jgi:hypothetical protein
LNVKPAPDAAQLLALLKDWAGSEALVRQVLVTNPEALYR